MKKNSYIRASSQLSDVASFVKYAKLRKKIKIINSLSELESDTINILHGDITISSVSDVNASIQNAVIIAEGNINLNNFPGSGDTFNPSAKSIALMATGSINIHSDFKEINGVFIAPSIDFASDVASGGTVETPLKINGNIIATRNAAEIKRSRAVVDRNKPSIFIVFKPKMYIDLLIHLSQIIQEGRLIQ